MSDETAETGDDRPNLFGLGDLREILRLIGQSDITEILIKQGEQKLHIKRGTVITAAQPIAMAPLMQPQMHPMALPTTQIQSSFPAASPSAEGAPSTTPAGHTITAPMVGTFYSSPSPKDPPFVQEGDEIRAGDAIGIIEAMKMMNEIESDISGRVVRMMVKNGQPVEYGQALVVIEPL
jgi:acetyl-CoA carboxylase biotin carboxyl carrier protein